MSYFGVLNPLPLCCQLGMYQQIRKYGFSQKASFHGLIDWMPGWDSNPDQGIQSG